MKKLFTYFWIALIPLCSIAQNQGASLRQEINLNQVYQQYGLTGDGVALCMIERGIDYRHPDFIDASGNTRIAFLYDMIDQSGANDPDNPYGVGTIYTRAEIDQALDNNTFLGSTDRYGHGTACTGIAAGDGSGATGAPYRGVAYGSTLIIVKVTHDPFPAINGIPAQAGFFDPTYIPIALDFIEDKTIELALPSVTLINLGSIGGPTDGSSEISRAMEDFAAPGRLIVCGSGDDGGGANRIIDNVSQGETVNIMINKAETGNLRFEAWYKGNDRFNVTITRPNGSISGPYTSPAFNTSVDQAFLADLNYYHRGSNFDFSGADNGERQILIDIFGQTGTYTISLTGATVTNGDYHASLNPAYFANNNGFLNLAISGGNINDYASSFNTIVPTNYNYDTAYVDINGIPRSRANEGITGDLWTGSSEGPTMDGRIGVDIASPGNVAVGAYSPDTYYAQFAFNLVQDGNGLYGVQTAVSAAAPVVTGVLALMLEVNPDLTVAEAKSILHQSARTDGFTGTTPNPVWGYGKLDALAAIIATQMTVNVEEVLPEEVGFNVSPNPAKERIFIRYSDQSGKGATLDILDMQSRLIDTRQISGGNTDLILPDVPTGMYLLRLTTDNKVAFKKLIIE